MGDPDKRSSIIQAAIPLFVAHGFEAASIADIAAGAGVAKGTVYLYFADKNQLVEEVFWHCHRLSVDACQVGLCAIPSAIGKLCHRAENAIRWALAHPLEVRVERMYFSRPRPGGAQNRYPYQHLHFEAVDPIVRAGLAAGELKALPSVLLGEMFYSAAGSMLHYFESNPEALDDSAFWESCLAAIRGCLLR